LNRAALLPFLSERERKENYEFGGLERTCPSVRRLLEKQATELEGSIPKLSFPGLESHLEHLHLTIPIIVPDRNGKRI
jgi:hypothetical protein